MDRAGKTNNVANIKVILGRVRASYIFCQKASLLGGAHHGSFVQEMHFGGRPQREFPKRPGLSVFYSR
jgi:hypothetical protein